MKDIVEEWNEGRCGRWVIRAGVIICPQNSCTGSAAPFLYGRVGVGYFEVGCFYYCKVLCERYSRTGYDCYGILRYDGIVFLGMMV